MLETKETLEFDSWPNLMRTHANLAKWYYSIYSIRKNVLVSQNLLTEQPNIIYIYVNICDINFIIYILIYYVSFLFLLISMNIFLVVR